MFSEGYHSTRPHADATVLAVPCLQTDPLLNNAMGHRVLSIRATPSHPGYGWAAQVAQVSHPRAAGTVPI